MTRIANDARPAPLSRPTETSSLPSTNVDSVDGAEDIVTVARTDVGARFDGGRGGSGVTVEGDQGGNTGVVPPRPMKSNFKDVAVATRALEKDFGVHVSGSFSAEELSRVHESLRLMGKMERAAMKGVELRREAAPSDAVRGHHGNDVGAVFDKGVAVDASTGARVQGPSITFYDDAFPGGDGHADSDRRFTMHVVLHEVGHAIEGRAIGDATAVKNEGATKVNQSNAARQALNPEYVDARRSFFALAHGEPRKTPSDDVLTSDPKAFLEEHDPTKSADPTEDTPQPLTDQGTKAFATAADAWHKAANTYASDEAKPEEKKAALRALSTAQKAVAAAERALPLDHPAKAAAARYAAVIAADTAIEQQSDEGERLERSVQNKLAKLVVTPDVTSTPADETLSALEAAFAEATSGDNAVTTYGEASPVENFAEAYALYRRDPSLLSDDAKAFFRKRLPR